MVFENERQMYEIIGHWLEHREDDPCEDVVYDAPDSRVFSFKFGSKKHKVDVLGLYEYEDDESDRLSYRFVGVEVKSTVKKVQSASRQALPMRSFCHEVYLAVPFSDFQSLSEREQRELRSQLMDTHQGLLLVKERRSARSRLDGLVVEELRVEPTSFRHSIYEDAVEHFRWNHDSEELLNRFRMKVGRGSYPWLKDDWWVDGDDDWQHGGETGGKGRIIFSDSTIQLEVDVNRDEFIKTIMLETPDDLERKVKSHIYDVPVYIAVTDYGVDMLTLNLSALRQSLEHGVLRGMALFLSVFGKGEVFLQTTVDERPVSLKNSYDEIVDVLRERYDNLLTIASVFNQGP